MPDDPLAGADYYNVGNSYRASHQEGGAVRSYVRCARLAPDYRSRAYFNAELAGMLFMSEYFTLAASFYSRALELEDSDLTRALYADALMYSGRYKEAEELFGEVLTVAPEWQLKHEVLPLIRAAASDTQLRERSAGWSVTDGAVRGEDRPLDAIHQGLRGAIRLDALNEDAWYWLALISFEDSPEEAAEMMLIAALARRHDASAWSWAFALEWSSRRRDERLVANRSDR